jgi:hypothetical protein
VKQIDKLVLEDQNGYTAFILFFTDKETPCRHPPPTVPAAPSFPVDKAAKKRRVDDSWHPRSAPRGPDHEHANEVTTTPSIERTCSRIASTEERRRSLILFVCV